MSWKRASDGSLLPHDPIVSPRVAYESLFGSFVPPDPAGRSRVRRALEERRSVLDLVGGDIATLLPQLTASDRQRMERHFEEIRGLERRLEPYTGGAGRPLCRVPAPPAADPPIGGAIKAYKGEGMTYTTTEGYSGEDTRADVLTDLISIAFACDLSRVASYMITEWKCYMNMFQVAGWKSDMHELTHFAAGKKLEAVSDSVAWCVKQWARLVAKLKKLPEPDGTSILDHTAMVLFFEGGHGWDPEGVRKQSPHSTENMAVLLAGHAGGLRARHVPAPRRHPASAILTAMNAVGVQADALGEVKGNIAELLG
jgi:hypothetical protein